MRILPLLLAALAIARPALAAEPSLTATNQPPVLFNTAFESASLGKIEKLSETEFRLHVKGQQDARGRNRQATWFLFRLDDVAGRELTLHLTSFKGEYNDKPANAPAGAWYRPVFSENGETWQHFTDAKWEVEKDELTLIVRPHGNTVWVSHVPPYPYARALGMIAELGRLPHVRAEVIGRSVLGRDLHLVTVTNPTKPDAGKTVIWMQARQHAWETGTSFLLEGALRFVASDEPAARKLRDENVFLFVPLINPDSVVRGEVRFNANGFDPNRQWDEVDLRDKRWLERNPEIWYVKKALLAQHARQPIALALNLHNTEMNEYMETMADTEPTLSRMQRFFDLAVAQTTFDPSRPKLTLYLSTSGPANSTNCLWREAGVPMMLMEQRIGPGRKLNGIATTKDRVELGRALIALMAEAAK
ncbi:MAG: M14-type cytosolic carboxypeptidase [Verrucomicrobia bacterium]|nr:M14-type cytosolic carboxypeptidase [Verrucomicrobiota bacterium]